MIDFNNCDDEDDMEIHRISIELKERIIRAKKLKETLWINQGDPTQDHVNQMMGGTDPDPTKFYLKRLFMWDPQECFKGIQILCPKCGLVSNRKGWMDEPRLIYGMDSNYWLLSRRHFCSKCELHFVVSNPDVLIHLPKFVQESFPAILSKKAGIDKRLMGWVESLGDTAVGPEAVRNMIREFHTLKYDVLKRNYYEGVWWCKERLKDSTLQIINVPLFTEFSSKTSYFGKCPSSNYIMKMLNQELNRKRNYFDYEVQRRGVSVASIDHSYKVTKHLAQLNGEKTFEGLFTCKNEYGEIRMQQLVQSSSMEELTLLFSNCWRTLTTNKMRLPEVVFDDKCCEHANFLQSVWPSISIQPGESLDLPILPIDRVVYLKTELECTMHLLNLLDSINSFPDGIKTNIGLDCEWNVNRRKGQPAKVERVATIQMAIQSKVFVFQTCQQLKLPLIIQTIICHPNVNLIGVRVKNDVDHIKIDFQIPVENFKSNVIDLNDLVATRRPTLNLRKNTSLDELTRTFVGYSLDKNTDLIKSIRTKSDWNSTLSKQQLEYAGRDALASLLVYEMVSNDNVDIPIEIASSKCPEIKNRVLLDVFHAMNRILKTIPTKHPFLYCFSQHIREAFFRYNEEDVGAVQKALSFQNPGSDSKMMFKEKTLNDINWVLKRVRRELYSPEELEENLTSLQEEFTQSQYCDTNGIPLLNQKSIEQFTNLLKHVRKGCLTDPKGLKLYYAIGKDELGLTLYRCIRGTSDVESFHQKLEMNFAPWNAGPEYADNNLALKRHRFNIRASQRNRKGFPAVGHYNHYLLDETYHFIRLLYGDLNTAKNWWDPVTIDPFGRNPTESFFIEDFGILPSIPVDKQVAVLDKDVADYPSSVRYLAIKTKTLIPYLPIRTQKEKGLYKSLITECIVPGSKNTTVDWVQFAEKWNQGNPVVCRDINESIFYKLPHHLSNYYLSYKRALIRQLLIKTTNARRVANKKLQKFTDYNIKEYVKVVKEEYKYISDGSCEEIQSDSEQEEENVLLAMAPRLQATENFLKSKIPQFIPENKGSDVVEASAYSKFRNRPIKRPTDESVERPTKVRSERTCTSCKNTSCPGRGRGACKACKTCKKLDCKGKIQFIQQVKLKINLIVI
jgi:hypothetical protein